MPVGPGKVMVKRSEDKFRNRVGEGAILGNSSFIYVHIYSMFVCVFVRFLKTLGK